MVRDVSPFRIVLPLLLVLSLLLSGCQTWERYMGPHRSYYRVRVTDPRGELIADYISEGYVARTERGYRFHAVERTSHEPFQQTFRYPQTRLIDVAGPNILVTHCGKPLWLYEMEGY